MSHEVFATRKDLDKFELFDACMLDEYMLMLEEIDRYNEALYVVSECCHDIELSKLPDEQRAALEYLDENYLAVIRCANSRGASESTGVARSPLMSQLDYIEYDARQKSDVEDEQKALANEGLSVKLEDARACLDVCRSAYEKVIASGIDPDALELPDYDDDELEAAAIKDTQKLQNEDCAYEVLLARLVELIEENCPRSLRMRRGCLDMNGGCASELAETLAFNHGDAHEAVETAIALCQENDW